jgi:hypothetical protein
MMTSTDLAALIDEYVAGLDAEIAILHRLEDTAGRQREASAAHDMPALHEAADVRDGLMASLVKVEEHLREVRNHLAQSRDEARRLPGYPEAAALHREAIALVSRILQTDADSQEALAAAELVRRDAARAVEKGETTLAAYRRVMTMPLGATLVDRRG